MNRFLSMLAVSGALAAVGALIYLPLRLATTEPPRVPPALPPKPAPVVTAASDATLVGRSQGRKSWELHAKLVVQNATDRTTTFEGVTRGTLYRDGKPAARVSAGRAVFDERAGVLRISEGIRLDTDGVSFRTEQMSWTTSTGRLRCPAPVTARWKEGRASVGRMQGSLKEDRWEGAGATMSTKSPQPEGESANDASIALLASQAGADAPAPNYKEVRIENADLWRTDRKARVHTLSGNVVLLHGDATLRCGKLVYDQKANKAVATGGVNVKTPTNVLDGESADIDFGARVMRVRGAKGVRIVAVPTAAAPADGGEKPAPTTINARSLDYYYRDKRADITGPLTCVNKDQTLTGDKAVWTAATETVTLTGNVRGKDDRGQTFEAPSVKVSLREGAEELEAPGIRATFLVDEEDKAPDATPSPAKP